MRSFESIEKFFHSVPINRFLGYRLESCETDTAVISVPPRPEYLGRNLAVCEVVVSQQDIDVAVALFTFLYLPLPTPG